jgi:hypothetical protein
MVLDATKVPQRPFLFRLGELSSIILCHSRVRNTLTERNITGVEFERAQLSTG